MTPAAALSVVRDLRKAVQGARRIEANPDDLSAEGVHAMASLLSRVTTALVDRFKSSPSIFVDGLASGFASSTGGQSVTLAVALLRVEEPDAYAEVMGLLEDLGVPDLIDRLLAKGAMHTPWAMDAAHFVATQAQTCPDTPAVTYTLDDVIANLPPEIANATPCAAHGDPACFECEDGGPAMAEEAPASNAGEMRALWQQALRDTMADHGYQIDPTTSAAMMTTWCERVAELAGADEVMVGTVRGEHVCMPGLPSAEGVVSWTQLSGSLFARFTAAGALELSQDAGDSALGLEADEAAALVTFAVQSRYPQLADAAAAAKLIVATGGHGYDEATGVPRLANGMDRVCYDTKTRTIVVQVDRDIPVDLQPQNDGRLRVVVLDAAGDDPGGRLLEVTCVDEVAPPRTADANGVPFLGNGMPRVSYDKEPNRVVVLVTEDLPVSLMGVDTGLRLRADRCGAGGFLLDVVAERVEPAPQIIDPDGLLGR